MSKNRQRSDALASEIGATVRSMRHRKWSRKSRLKGVVRTGAVLSFA
jgi:hypothetical protein